MLLWQHRAEFSRSLQLGPVRIAAFIVLLLAGHLQRTIEFKFLLQRLGIREPFWEGAKLIGAATLLNYLPLNVGLAVRASVLKRDRKLPFSRYVALELVNLLVTIATAGWIGSLIVIASPRATADKPLLTLILLSVVVGSTALLWTPTRWLSRFPGWIGERLSDLAQGLSSIRGSGGALLVLGLFSVAKLLIVALRFWLAFATLGYSVDLFQSVVFATIATLIAVVNVTPGGLGFREVLVGAVASQLGLDYATGIAAASVDRVMLLIVTIVLGIPGLLDLRRRNLLRTSPAAPPVAEGERSRGAD